MTLPLVNAHEYAIVVLSGTVEIPAEIPAEISAGSPQAGARVVPGELAYLGLGRDELELKAAEDSRLLLLGGAPFESRILMWWNFVGRSREEMDAATADWNSPATEDSRFGDPGSALPRIPAPATPWGPAERGFEQQA